MRRLAVALVMLVTGYLLIATSPARHPCADEAVTRVARTSCGPDSEVTLVVTPACTVTAAGGPDAGLPGRGDVIHHAPDASALDSTLSLWAAAPDGGEGAHCLLEPAADGSGWSVSCTRCGSDADAGCVCGGALTAP